MGDRPLHPAVISPLSVFCAQNIYSAMNNKQQPDQDSMMALEALMKIKSATNAESPPRRNQEGVQEAVTRTAPPQNVAQHRIPVPIISIPPPPFNMAQMSQFQGYAMLPPMTERPPVPKVGQQSEEQQPRLQTPPLNVESTATAAMDPSLRQEKIEAALRSKPQRGRKRDNLSVEERLELTRTRNREHAKSTR